MEYWLESVLEVAKKLLRLTPAVVMFGAPGVLLMTALGRVLLMV